MPCILSQLAQRILVSFILYSLYAPYPVAVNPFKSALLVTYIKEREKAVGLSKSGGISPNEQFVWVLWKILKGDGNDVCVRLVGASTKFDPPCRSHLILPALYPAAHYRLSLERLIWSSMTICTIVYLTCSSFPSLFVVGPDALFRDNCTYSYFQHTSRQSASSDTNGSNLHNYPTGKDTRIQRQTPDLYTRSPVSTQDDRVNEQLVQAMRLLLAARERVLTLTEQRVRLSIDTKCLSSHFL